jgi:hypothetical protein
MKLTLGSKVQVVNMQCSYNSTQKYGSPMGNSQKNIEKNMRFQRNVMVGLNRTLEPMKILQHGHQKEKQGAI